MSYKETVDFLYSRLPAYHRLGKAAYKNDLQNTLSLDKYLDHPHEKYKTIHVGGTNGKGSVSHMIASVLMEAGYKTGLYTSPHLRDFRERIRVNGRMIEKKAVTDFLKKNTTFLETIKPSFFEMTVAMAFDYFAKVGVEIAVIEVGLGGRLDSTNIIRPVLSVITNIGHDHMDLLGNTLQKIAEEKAGIIKTGIPVIISETQHEIKNIFIEKAGRSDSEITFADQNFDCRESDFDYLGGYAEFIVRDKISGELFKGKTPLGGNYQIKNLQALFQVFKTLRNNFNVSDKNIIDGIRKTITNTHLEGRWQVINNKPLTICDTGHNKEGLEYIINQIDKLQKASLQMVLGFVNDKDLSSILPLFPSDAIYYFTKASVPRALDEKILMQKAFEAGLKGNCFPDVKSAVKAALGNASAADLIFIGGSTFVVADALVYFKKIQ